MKKIFYLLLAVVLMSSCTSTKQLRYFNDLPDSTVVNLPPMVQEERYIQDGDRLIISISGQDPLAAAMFNSNAGGTSGRESEIAGMLVESDGTIEFPYLGKVMARGLTAVQYKQKLTSLLGKYLKEPLVSVRFFQIKFTVLGEVRSPGTYTLPLQRTTFLDALGAAGDLPISAKRYDIQIYRDYNGKRTIFKVDLRTKEILYNASLFQIKHNDVIYVQPRDSRRFSEEARFYVSMVTMAVGIIAIFSRF
jgi:polysaccharide export outer membrane protein